MTSQKWFLLTTRPGTDALFHRRAPQQLAKLSRAELSHLLAAHSFIEPSGKHTLNDGAFITPLVGQWSEDKHLQSDTFPAAHSVGALPLGTSRNLSANIKPHKISI